MALKKSGKIATQRGISLNKNECVVKQAAGYPALFLPILRGVHMFPRLILSVYVALCSSSVLAEMKASDEETYAIMVASIQVCGEAFPADGGMLEKVSSSLKKLTKTVPQLIAVQDSPTLDNSVAEARVAVQKLILTYAYKKTYCEGVRIGRFGQMEIPVEP